MRLRPPHLLMDVRGPPTHTRLCLSSRVLFATIMKNLVAVKNQGETISSSCSSCWFLSGRSSSSWFDFL